MIRFDKFTLKSQEALQAAQSHAQEKGNPQIAPEHLLWALIQQKDGVVLPVLQKLGANIQTLAAGSCRRGGEAAQGSGSGRDSHESGAEPDPRRSLRRKRINSRTSTSAPSIC